MFVKVYGLAARDPKLYCSVIKTRMMGLPLDFETFDATAHQWVLDQYELFDTVQDAICPGEYKMPESEFVTHVISSLEEYMPKFAELCHSVASTSP